MLTVAIIVCAVFLQFFVVDHWMGASGVLSVVVFGVLMSKDKDKVPTRPLACLTGLSVLLPACLSICMPYLGGVCVCVCVGASSVTDCLLWSTNLPTMPRTILADYGSAGTGME